MNDERAAVGIGWRHRLDATHEQQERRGVVGDAVVGPGCELELPDFAPLLRVILVRNRKSSNRVRRQLHDVTQLHAYNAVRLRAAVRPILIAFDLQTLRKV